MVAQKKEYFFCFKEKNTFVLRGKKVDYFEKTQ